MDALKHNFLLRGFFKGRGYFDLAQLSPADYRQGALTKGSDRHVDRVWLASDGLFEPEPERPQEERLSDPGKVRVSAAMASYLEQIGSSIVMVEGYSQQGTLEERYLQSRVRASMVRDYLVAKFHLDPQATGAMPLSADSPGSPGATPWNGVALAIVLPKGTLVQAKTPAPRVSAR
jgi:phospholipid/cholesterol/gamma-HCH transport system substrate-binding protein